MSKFRLTTTVDIDVVGNEQAMLRLHLERVGITLLEQEGRSLLIESSVREVDALKEILGDRWLVEIIPDATSMAQRRQQRETFFASGVTVAGSGYIGDWDFWSRSRPTGCSG